MSYTLGQYSVNYYHVMSQSKIRQVCIILWTAMKLKFSNDELSSW